MTAQTLYTHDYLDTLAYRFYRYRKHNIQLELEKAQDKSYSRTYHNLLMFIELFLKTGAEFGEQTKSLHEHYGKLGMPLNEIIEIIKTHYASYKEQKDTELTIEAENHKLLFGLIDLPNVPKSIIRKNKEGKIVEKQSFFYDGRKALKNLFGKTAESPITVNVEHTMEFTLGKFPYNFYDTREIFKFLMYNHAFMNHIRYAGVPDINNNDMKCLITHFYTTYGGDFDREEMEQMLKQVDNDIENTISEEIEVDSENFEHEGAENDSENTPFEKVEDEVLPFIIEKEVPKIEWLGTSKQLCDLFAALYKKNWIEDFNLDLIEKYFTQTENIRSMDLSKVVTFKDIKVNDKNNAKPEEGKILWIGLQRNLAELFIELQNKKWISPIPKKLINHYFTNAKTIIDILKLDKTGNKPTYSQVYSDKYKTKFEKIPNFF